MSRNDNGRLASLAPRSTPLNPAVTPTARPSRRRTVAARCSRPGRQRLARGREREAEGRALAGRARDEDVAALQLDQRAGDGQSEAGPVNLLGRLVAGAEETGEELGLLVRRKPDTGIVDVHPHLTALAACAHLDG